MTPTEFPQANTVFGPPSDLDESQCMKICAYVGQVKSGSVDGATLVVTAWKPSESDLVSLNEGKPIFLSFLGGLPPHFVTDNFEAAISPQ